MTYVSRWIALSLLSLGTIAGMMGSAADAAFVTVYKSETSFLEATTSRLIDFEGIVPSDEYSPLSPSILVGGVTFRSTGDLGIAGKDAPIAGSPFDSALLFSNFGTPIVSDLTTAGTGFTAVGGLFDNLNTSSGTVTLTVTGTTGILAVDTFAASSLGLGQPHNFFGYTVRGDTIISITASTSKVFPGIDNFRFGYAGLTVVPEPSSLTLLSMASLAGFALLQASRHRAWIARTLPCRDTSPRGGE